MAFSVCVRFSDYGAVR
ncbi:hypothetical protein MO988_22500 [Vibrio vulnificus]|nr:MULTISPECIES: hypothetical protein [Vibrio]MCR9352494.1 hypothetical protein [Vibrio alginolyticus]MCS0433071.1 hypothetical protein [Vibrio diabolicus]MCJ0824137.1 hypothetical protein [Vibrio vulnificus]MCR9361637.1 hypothetical protein [Vibrio alginolyticus]MCU8150620.1 hypothetical protein [Vibrio vulnificus]